MVLSGLRLKNTMASPFLGLAAAAAAQIVGGSGGTEALRHSHGHGVMRALARPSPWTHVWGVGRARGAAQLVTAGQFRAAAAVLLMASASAASLATWPWAHELKGSNRFCTLGWIHWEGCSGWRCAAGERVRVDKDWSFQTRH